MKGKLENDLLVVTAVTGVLAIIIVVFPSNVLRIVLGLPFLLFFPGYTLSSALFPRRTDLDGLGRVALSFGLSIAVVTLVGLVLNYAWEIEIYPMLVSLAVVILSMSAVAWYRRRAFPPDDRLRGSFKLRLTDLKGQSGVDKILSVVLVAAILGAIGTLVYVIAEPKVGEKFTEFYVLGLEGKADYYPVEFEMVDGAVFLVKYKCGKAFRDLEEQYGRVTLGIVNREHREASYQVELRIPGGGVKVWLDGEEVQQLGTIVLEHEGKWEREIGFAPTEIGGSTTLTSRAVRGQKTLVVAEVDDFEAGDYIQVGSYNGENAQLAEIEAVDSGQSTITLKTELEHDHDQGDTVIEKQRVEFVLYMDGEPYFEDDESLHLWVEVKK